MKWHFATVIRFFWNLIAFVEVGVDKTTVVILFCVLIKRLITWLYRVTTRDYIARMYHVTARYMITSCDCITRLHHMAFFLKIPVEMSCLLSEALEMILQRTAWICGQGFTQLNTIDDFVFYAAKYDGRFCVFCFYSYAFQTEFSLFQSVLCYKSFCFWTQTRGSPNP
jgi:hypothetical protein